MKIKKLYRPNRNRLGVSARIHTKTACGLDQPLRICLKHNGQIKIGAGFGSHYLPSTEINSQGFRRIECTGRYRDKANKGMLSLDEKRLPEEDAWIDAGAFDKLISYYMDAEGAVYPYEVEITYEEIEGASHHGKE